MRQHDFYHWLLKTKRLAQVAVCNSDKILCVLHRQRLVQAQRVTKLLQVILSSAFAEHLTHGIAGHNVRKQKHHGQDEPESGKGEQKAQGKVTYHFARRAFAGVFFPLAPETAVFSEAAAALDFFSASGAVCGVSSLMPEAAG